jgi:hypothetical protein
MKHREKTTSKAGSVIDGRSFSGAQAVVREERLECRAPPLVRPAGQARATSACTRSPD